MILEDFHKYQGRNAIMSNHRTIYNKIKGLVIDRRFDQIDLKQVNKEKDIVIKHLNNCESEEMVEQFQQLSFYQQKYLILSKFLATKNQKGGYDSNQINKIVHSFQQIYSSQKQMEQSNDIKKFRKIDSTQLNEKLSKPDVIIRDNKNSQIQNAGLGSAIIQFFEKKQKQSKPVGFKDLIQKRSNNVSTSSKPFSRKPKQPSHDVQIKKLLQQNKRLHLQLQKRGRQDIQLSQYQKNVLRQQRERCMKRIEQLQQQVEQLARNNFKLQQIQRQRSRKVVQTFVNEDTTQNLSKNQLLPYYIKTRHNDLKVITEKNKISKAQSAEKQLLNLVNNIPPIERRQQYSFDDQININQYSKSRPIDNLILQGLLQDMDQKPKIKNFTASQEPKSPRRSIFSGAKQVYKPNKNNMYMGQQKTRKQNINKYRSNDALQNGSRFQSFSIANTINNNSSLFLNASKNEINIDPVTSTRNKVAFFKNSLVIFKDDSFQIAFKRSNLDSNLSKIRLIFYINNKTDKIQPVDIQYDFQTMYYFLTVTQKLKSINPYTQGRQVIEVQLTQKCCDLNSVMDAHVTISQRKFDLWVPLCFILWTTDSFIQSGQMGFMVVQPDRQFSNYQNTSKILPLSRQIFTSPDQIQTYVFGRSKFGNHQIKLTWWQKELTIDANIKILDFLAFVMHHFK